MKSELSICGKNGMQFEVHVLNFNSLSINFKIYKVDFLRDSKMVLNVRFYSVIAPGDTVNIVGEFDNLGNCNVDHDHNFIIVHPDILVSGTRVIAFYLS